MDLPKSTYFKKAMESLPDEVKLKLHLKDEDLARGAKGTNGAGCADALSWEGHSLFRNQRRK